MSRENVRAVEQVYARATASLEMSPELVDADMVLDATEAAPDSELIRGRAAVQVFFREYWGMFDAYQVEIGDVLYADDTHVVNVALDRARMKGSDAEVGNRYFHVWTFAASKIVRLSVHSQRNTALNAVGLEG
jgi:ketosteroid isomerase-like protein